MRRFERGHRASCGGDARPEQQEDAGVERVGHHAWCHAAEVSRPEVRADDPQGHRREHVAGNETEHAAQHAQDHALADEQRHELAPGDAEHAQQRELCTPAHHRQRLRREYEQATREQRHQCEHVEVHAVSAGQARSCGDRGGRARNRDTGGQGAGNRLRGRGHVGPGPQAQIDAAQGAELIEGHLGAGDVHDGDALRDATAENPGHAQRDRLDAGLHRDLLAHTHCQPLRRRGAQEDRIGLQRIEPAGRGRHEGRLDLHRAEDVDSQHVQAFVAIGEARVDLDHGAGGGDLGPARKLWIHGLVEARTRAADLQIRITGERLHAQRKLVHGGAVDELHGEPQRDPEGDRQYGKAGAQPVLGKRRRQYRPQHARRGHVSRLPVERRAGAVRCGSTAGSDRRCVPPRGSA